MQFDLSLPMAKAKDDVPSLISAFGEALDPLTASRLNSMAASGTGSLNAFIRLSPEMAGWLLAHPRKDLQRDINEGQVKAILREMLAGTFVPELSPMIVGVLDGGTYFLGGRHRAMAVRHSQVTLTHPFLFQCFGTFEDMRAFYARTHRTLAVSRTNRNDISLAGIQEIGPSERNVVVSAVRFLIEHDVDPSLPYGGSEEFKDDGVMTAVTQVLLPDLVEVLSLVHRSPETETSFRRQFQGGLLGLSAVCHRYRPAELSDLLRRSRIDYGHEKESPALLFRKLVTQTDGRMYAAGAGRQRLLEHFCWTWRCHLEGRKTSRFSVGHLPDAIHGYQRPLGVPAPADRTRTPADEAVTRSIKTDIRAIRARKRADERRAEAAADLAPVIAEAMKQSL